MIRKGLQRPYGKRRAAGMPDQMYRPARKARLIIRYKLGDIACLAAIPAAVSQVKGK